MGHLVVDRFVVINLGLFWISLWVLTSLSSLSSLSSYNRTTIQEQLWTIITTLKCCITWFHVAGAFYYHYYQYHAFHLCFSLLSLLSIPCFSSLLLTIIIIINTMLFIFASQTGLTIKSLTAEAILKIDLLQVLNNLLNHQHHHYLHHHNRHHNKHNQPIIKCMP